MKINNNNTKQPSEDPEDRRQASSLTVTLSTQVIAASLAVIAIIGAISTFVLDKRQTPWWTGGYIAVCLTIEVISIFLGGQAIWKTIKDGYRGTWAIAGKKYDWQAKLCLTGFVLTLLLLFVGTDKRDPTTEALLKFDSIEIQHSQALDSAIQLLSKAILIPKKVDSCVIIH